MGIFSFLRRKKEVVEPTHTQPGQTQPEPGQSQPDTPQEVPEERLEKRLEKTRRSFGGGLLSFFTGRKKIDDNLLEELESQLIMSDISVATTAIIIDSVTAAAKKSGGDEATVRATLRAELINVLLPCEIPLEIPDDIQPYVLLVVGVNGAGKTTTIGKLTQQLQAGGKSVMLAAGDTFRAAAVEQLQTWGERNNVAVISQGSGADSASVIFDAVQSAKARGIDVVIADTAGRLHTQSGLMDELGKVSRVIKKIDPAAPHETLLVLDGTTGQNGLQQGQQFLDAVGVSGLAITKLDGTARGGVVFTMADQLNLPIRFIGVGEGLYDLRVFQAEEFVDALLGNEQTPAATG